MRVGLGLFGWIWQMGLDYFSGFFGWAWEGETHSHWLGLIGDRDGLACLFLLDFQLGLGILGPMKLKEMTHCPFYQQSGNVNWISVPGF